MTIKNDEIQSVSNKILDKFLNELAMDSDMEEASCRLRKVIFEDKIINDKTIREALFGENET